MSLPQIPATFPFRQTQSNNELLLCLFDLRSRVGRLIALDHYESEDDSPKIYTFTVMAIEFPNSEFAEAFMGDEHERMKLMGKLTESPKPIGDQTFICIKESEHKQSNVSAYYSIRQDTLVIRLGISTMGISPQDSVLALTFDLAKEVLQIYQDVDLKT